MEEINELKRYNIKPIRELTHSELEYIAIEVVKKIETMIKDFDGEYVYNNIMNAKMYLAQIPEQYTNVNYIPQPNAIYIRGEENIRNIDEILIHEIIHYIQCNQEGERIAGMPEQMGLCRFGLRKISGLAINEVAIQVIISIIFNNEIVNSEIYGINVNAIKNKPFPIISALFQQVTYIMGYEDLLKSILKNTDDFQDAFERFAGIKSYSFLRQAFDIIMKARDSINENLRLLKTEKDHTKKIILEKQIDIYEKQIKEYFLSVQRLCYKEYFGPLIKKVKTKEDLENLKEEIKKYHERTGSVDGKDDFMIYAQKEILKLNKKLS